MPLQPLKQYSSDDLKQLFDGATLVLPAVTTANVPQLSVDLLLSSVPHSLLGNFHSPHLEPIVGHGAIQNTDAKPTNELVTCAQLYSIPSLRMLVLQQRAPCIVGRHAAFVEELLQFARHQGIAQLIALTSSQAFRQTEDDLDAVHPISYYLIHPQSSNSSSASTTNATAAVTSSSSSSQDPTEQPSTLASLLSSALRFHSLHVNSLQQDELPLRRSEIDAAESTEDSVALKAAEEEELQVAKAAQPSQVPGSGITRPLLEQLSTQSNPFVSLFLHLYANEGANDKDAAVMSQSLYALRYLQVQQQRTTNAKYIDAAHEPKAPQEMNWQAPESWSALFGNEPDESLYL